MNEAGNHTDNRAETVPSRVQATRLRQVCADLYQVIGTMSEHCPDPADPAIIKALDNASDAANGDPVRHNDLLPFVLAEPKYDARLSAASDLLAACKDCLKSRGDWVPTMAAAIAKAEGRS